MSLQKMKKESIIEKFKPLPRIHFHTSGQSVCKVGKLIRLSAWEVTKFVRCSIIMDRGERVSDAVW